MKSLFGKVQAFAYVNAGAITKTAASVVALGALWLSLVLSL